MSNILITGANGFIGSHIVDQFLKEGIKARCLVRHGSDLRNIDQSKVEIVFGDITDFDSLNNALIGMDYVVHNAAKVKDWGNYNSFYNSNVQGTLNVLRACVKNKITNIVMTGSISSYGEENCMTVKDETSDYNSHYNYFLDSIFPNAFNYYRDTKALATRKATDYAKEKGLNLTIIEPTWVFGEREFNTGFYEYMNSARKGMAFAPGSRKNRFHVIYAVDLAEAYVMAFRKMLTGVNRFIIGNKEANLMDDIFTLFCKEANIKKPFLLPKWFIYPTGFVLEMIFTLIRTKDAPLLSRSRINMFYDNIEYSTIKAKEVLGFTNQYSLEEGISRTVAWYKENKKL